MASPPISAIARGVVAAQRCGVAFLAVRRGHGCRWRTPGAFGMGRARCGVGRGGGRHQHCGIGRRVPTSRSADQEHRWRFVRVHADLPGVIGGRRDSRQRVDPRGMAWGVTPTSGRHRRRSVECVRGRVCLGRCPGGPSTGLTRPTSWDGISATGCDGAYAARSCLAALVICCSSFRWLAHSPQDARRRRIRAHR